MREAVTGRGASADIASLRSAFSKYLYRAQYRRANRRRPDEGARACVDIFKSAECTNYLAACGYVTTGVGSKKR
jgi:hypothetical protein